MLVLTLVANVLDYVLLVNIDLFGTKMKSQISLLPGNPSYPASVILYCWGAWSMQLGMAEELGIIGTIVSITLCESFFLFPST